MYLGHGLLGGGWRRDDEPGAVYRTVLTILVGICTATFIVIRVRHVRAGRKRGLPPTKGEIRQKRAKKWAADAAASAAAASNGSQVRGVGVPVRLFDLG